MPILIVVHCDIQMNKVGLVGELGDVQPTSEPVGIRPSSCPWVDGPFSDEGERAFMEPELLRPSAEIAQPYATCTIHGILLHLEYRSERGGRRGHQC